jgi:hypothetical protein
MIDDEMKSHDDYESFAKYLGVDYEDYAEMIGDFELCEDEIEIEYALSI